MDALINALKELAKELSLSKFEWDIPNNCPISIPAELKDGHSKNIFLKENFYKIILNDSTLTSHYWAIQEWGRIGSFKKNDKNDRRIINFLTELNKKSLTRHSFECISSLSKVASFINPNEYAIYDSRAIYTLNWLIFNHSKQKELFPQPIGRSSELAKYDMQTIFRLTKAEFSYKTHKVAFHHYCELLKKLAHEIFGINSKPYQIEMLLFMAAPTSIISQIESSVALSISA
ncbi:hypothetical protein [Pseudomonas sp. GOM6]|uniref:hypothetical protein n=1 Tax=Pseudomonas sp. GOM6 TaxID=3036944 RepID=UPI0024099401|nr:hypothetical protein [Pseudomonas sp. GOM6]MDG1581757.1 hypothetical protein [Pseudomonas sp. GOM6]